jgi:hypothetical protein
VIETHDVRHKLARMSPGLMNDCTIFIQILPNALQTYISSSLSYVVLPLPCPTALTASLPNSAHRFPMLVFFISISICLASSFASIGSRSLGMGLLIVRLPAYRFISLRSSARALFASNFELLVALAFVSGIS